MAHIVQLKKIFENSGQSLDIDVTISPEEFAEKRPYDTFAAPVEIKGRVSNRAGLVTLNAKVKAKFRHNCDRCLKVFEREYECEMSHTLVTSLANEDEYDEYVICPDNTLDIGELALEDLALEMPSKILCKEDCLGLCIKCGKDLNEGECSCDLN